MSPSSCNSFHINSFNNPPLTPLWAWPCTGWYWDPRQNVDLEVWAGGQSWKPSRQLTFEVEEGAQQLRGLSPSGQWARPHRPLQSPFLQSLHLGESKSQCCFQKSSALGP